MTKGRQRVHEFMGKVEELAEEHGFKLVDWEREILNFGPTITNNYVIRVHYEGMEDDDV